MAEGEKLADGPRELQKGSQQQDAQSQQARAGPGNGEKARLCPQLWGEMDTASLLLPSKRNVSRGSVQAGPDLRSKRELGPARSLLRASSVRSNSNQHSDQHFPWLSPILSCSAGKPVGPQRSDDYQTGGKTQG